MNCYFRNLFRSVLASLLAITFVLSQGVPVIAETAAASANANAGTIVGSVVDSVTGAPIAGASVFVGNGSQGLTAKTDARGSFRLQNVEPGLYSLTAYASGYNAERVNDFPVVAGTTNTLTIALVAMSLNSLRTIASVRTATDLRGRFNDSTASTSVVSSQVFARQGQSQVMQVLDQIPGFTTAHESANNNPAAPGAASYPNIRGAQTYETASLIDGHAVARIGGGYRTQYLNPALFQSVEVIKGPGASAPNINYAIAGSVNFQTLEPTLKPQTTIRYGIDSWASQTFSMRSTGTLGFKDRLSYALVYAVDGQNGYLQDYKTYYPIGQWVNVGTLGAHTASGKTPTQPYAYVDNNVNPVVPPAPSSSNHGLSILNPNTANQNNYGETGLYACCAYPSTFNQETAQLVKFRYKLSDVSTLTYSYMATHGTTNENGNHLWQADTYFNPMLNMTNATAAQIANVKNASYQLPIGSQFLYDDNFLVPDQLRHQDEPISQIDLKTTLGKNITVLARGFGALTKNDATNGVTSPTGTVTTYAQVYGAYVPCYGSAGYANLISAYGNNYGANCAGAAKNTADPIVYTGQLEPITYGAGPQQSPYCLNPNFNPANPSQNAYYISPTGSGKTGVVNGVQSGVASSTALGMACGVGAPGYVGLFQKGITSCNNYTGPPNCAYFASHERDAILGGTLELLLNAGPNLYTLSYDSNETKAEQYYYQDMPNIMPVPPGDKQSFTTLMERGDWQLSPKLNAMLSLYQNKYMFHISRDNGFSFQDTASNHFDGRVGLTYQPNSKASLRFSAGSSIAPPYIFGILSSGSHIPGAPVTPTFTNLGANSFYTVSGTSSNLSPETAFGWDVGGDFRVIDRYTIFSTDLFREDIFNQYLIGAGGGGYPDGSYNDGTDGEWPLFVAGPANVARARMFGLEFSLARTPNAGFGYVVNGTIQSSYPYDIACSTYGLPLNTKGCVNPSGNLIEIPGINYQVPGGGTGVNTGQNNVTGTARNAIPYSQMYGELNYTTRSGDTFYFNEQYYGNNNTYNRPAFFVAGLGASLPMPEARNSSIEISVYNLFNAYPLGYVQQDQGILEPTITPQAPGAPSLLAYTNGLNLGPRRVTLQFTTRF